MPNEQGGAIQVLDSSVAAINQALAQVLERIDDLKGLRGPVTIHDRVGVTAPIDPADAVNLDTLVAGFLEEHAQPWRWTPVSQQRPNELEGEDQPLDPHDPMLWRLTGHALDEAEVLLTPHEPFLWLFGAGNEQGGSEPQNAPPNIAVASDIGAVQGRYAREDHTHGVADGFVQLAVPIFTGGADLVLTNHPNSEQDLQNNVRYRKTLDLVYATEFRLIGRLAVASASPNTPRVYAQYSTDDTVWNALEAAGSSVLSMAATGILDTGWLTTAAGAKVASVHIRVAQHGGDGAADPAWGYLMVYFRV